MLQTFLEFNTPLESRPITDQDLKILQQQLDMLWKRLGIEVEFSRHFLDRANDARNGKQITFNELQKLFRDVYTKYGAQLAHYGDKFEGVLSDLSTSINVPFGLKWDPRNRCLDLVGITVMRKKNFVPNKPTEKKFQVQHFDAEFAATLKGAANLKETATPSTSVNGIPAIDDVDASIFYLNDPANVDKLNAYIASQSGTPFINPYHLINRLKRKLITVGIGFEDVYLTGDSGTVRRKITQWGGASGMNLDGVVRADDGTNVPSGLELRIDYFKAKGLYTLDISIVPSDDVYEENIKEDDLKEAAPVSLYGPGILTLPLSITNAKTRQDQVGAIQQIIANAKTDVDTRAKMQRLLAKVQASSN
jgi:hypothetical protein